MTAAKNRNLDFCSKRCFREGNRNLAVKIVAFSCEEVVILYSYLDDKVAVGAAVSARRALSAKNYVLIGVNSRGNINLELLVELYEALAVTVVAGVFTILPVPRQDEQVFCV